MILEIIEDIKTQLTSVLGSAMNIVTGARNPYDAKVFPLLCIFCTNSREGRDEAVITHDVSFVLAVKSGDPEELFIRMHEKTEAVRNAIKNVKRGEYDMSIIGSMYYDGGHAGANISVVDTTVEIVTNSCEDSQE